MEISFAPGFLRSVRSLPLLLRDEIKEKIRLFSDEKNHTSLRVHKLSGRLKNCYAFSVNYHIRIIFEYTGKPKRAYLLTVGDHDIYNQY